MDGVNENGECLVDTSKKEVILSKHLFAAYNYPQVHMKER